MASLSALSQKSALRPSVARPSRLLVQAKAAVKSKSKAMPMVCLDCGYVYDGKVAFDELPGSYSCPACGSKKNRFRAFSGSPARGNDVKSMQARRVALREELAASGEDGSDNTFLLLTLATIVASIGGFIYLKGGL